MLGSIILICLLALVEAKPQWNDQYPDVVDFPGVGYPSPESRIVNGKEAKLGQFPYQVSSRTKKGPHKYSLCGGSIISKKVVLTAGHCTVDHDSFELGFGSITITEPPVSMTATKKVLHEKFNPSNLNNDIALLFLPKELTYTDNIAAIQLPSFSQNSTRFVDSKATVSGHGKTGDNKGSSNQLMYVNTKVISNADCRKQFGKHKQLIQPFTLCVVGWDNANQSTCTGDSGGPLVTYDDKLGENIQIGVVSFVAKKGCEAQLPTGFARVTYFLGWIKENSEVEIRS